MTWSSIQNFKVLDSWVFFLICCLTYSFLFNMKLRPIFRYLTISLSSKSLSSTLIYSFSSENILKYEYLIHKRPSLVLSFTYLIEQTCLKLQLGRLSIQRSNCTCLSWSPPTISFDITCWKNREKINFVNIKQEWDMS